VPRRIAASPRTARRGARARPGFRRRSILAQIGDPFNLQASGFELKVGGAVPPLPDSTSVPEPATLTLLGLGCLAIRPLIGRRRR
jgi:PEP-CTERM motif